MSVHITKGAKGAGEWCDRRSSLGNPFNLAHESQRDQVCDAYQGYFHLVVDRGYSPYVSVIETSDRYKLGVTPQWKQPTRGQFLAALDRLSTILKDDGKVTLKCWCINVEVKSRVDLEQKKRCHCLSLAGCLLPEVGSFSEQLSLGV